MSNKINELAGMMPEQVATEFQPWAADGNQPSAAIRLKTRVSASAA